MIRFFLIAPAVLLGMLLQGCGGQSENENARAVGFDQQRPGPGEKRLNGNYEQYQSTDTSRVGPGVITHPEFPDNNQPFMQTIQAEVARDYKDHLQDFKLAGSDFDITKKALLDAGFMSTPNGKKIFEDFNKYRKENEQNIMQSVIANTPKRYPPSAEPPREILPSKTEGETNPVTNGVGGSTDLQTANSQADMVHKSDTLPNPLPTSHHHLAKTQLHGSHGNAGKSVGEPAPIAPLLTPTDKAKILPK